MSEALVTYFIHFSSESHFKELQAIVQKCAYTMVIILQFIIMELSFKRWSFSSRSRRTRFHTSTQLLHDGMHYTSIYTCPRQYTRWLTDGNLEMNMAFSQSLVTMSYPPYVYDYMLTKRMATLDLELNFSLKVILYSFQTTSHLYAACRGHLLLLMFTVLNIDHKNVL
jgi:hypothetical protein